MDDAPETLNVSVGTANMVGVLLSTVTFGVHLTLFAGLNRLYFGWRGIKGQWRPSKHDWRLLVYVYVLFLLSITGLCLQTWVNHDAFVIHGAFRGGPLAYLAQQTRHPVHVAMTTVYIVLNWFADGMLLYRACVFSRHSIYVVTGSILTLTALIGVGGFFIHTVAKAGLNLWTGGEFTPCIAYISLSFSINLVLTVGIVGRLFYIRRQFGVLGSEVVQLYTSIAAMLIESAAPYTLVALLAIISCARRIPMQDALLPMLGQLQAIPPLLIILRVLEGHAITSETWSQPISFRHNSSPSVSSNVSPTYRGSTTKVNTVYTTSSSLGRSSRSFKTPTNDVKQTCLVDCEALPYTDIPSRRPALRISTNFQRTASGSMTAVDEESACSSLDHLPCLTPTPRSPPPAHTPRSTETVTAVSRGPWL